MEMLVTGASYEAAGCSAACAGASSFDAGNLLLQPIQLMLL